MCQGHHAVSGAGSCRDGTDLSITIRLSVSLWGKEGGGIIPYLHLSTCTGVSHDPLHLKPALRQSDPKRLHIWTLNISFSFPGPGGRRAGLLLAALLGASGAPSPCFCLLFSSRVGAS